jgi:hypothetical protein
MERKEVLLSTCRREALWFFPLSRKWERGEIVSLFESGKRRSRVSLPKVEEKKFSSPRTGEKRFGFFPSPASGRGWPEGPGEGRANGLERRSPETQRD